MARSKVPKRGVAQESKVPEPIINHFDEFCKFLRGQEWMSQEFRTDITLRFMAAQRDAYDRGELNGKAIARQRSEKA
jgi:hypothetical protein